MSQTLRRNIAKKFEAILEDYIDDNGVIAQQLADIAVEAFYEKGKVKIDLSKVDPAWAVLFGDKVDQEALDENALNTNALETFERDMQTPDSWNWYPARTSEEKAWKYLRDFVVEKFREDRNCFQKYQTWRTQPFARGAMSNLAIKRNPENFPVSWSDFLASTAINNVKAEIKTDDKGNIISY